ncbi:hypothetical protein DBV05_g91 [Lasiodiplodia theobromae]|uniref:Uncharacterized protein n=1 Tax=Lasiodiplodia theobromae TaxID=45133 RepID=A0A5N5DU64_9PEZI|nr:hypothetical protein DBV05_g91 [Lasiodiplodia theobromae]
MAKRKPHRYINACLLNPHPVMTVNDNGVHGHLHPRIQIRMSLHGRSPTMLTNKVNGSFPFARGRFPHRAIRKATPHLHTLRSIRRAENIKTWLHRNLPAQARASHVKTMMARNATDPSVVKKLFGVASASEYFSCWRTNSCR